MNKIIACLGLLILSACSLTPEQRVGFGNAAAAFAVRAVERFNEIDPDNPIAITQQTKDYLVFGCELSRDGDELLKWAIDVVIAKADSESPVTGEEILGHIQSVCLVIDGFPVREDEAPLESAIPPDKPGVS
jgi:hypothetical protein